MAFYFPQEIGPPPTPTPVPSRSLGAGGTSFKVNSRLERRRSRFMEQPFPFTYRQKPSRKLKSKKHNFERNPFSLSGRKKNNKPRPPDSGTSSHKARSRPWTCLFYGKACLKVPRWILKYLADGALQFEYLIGGNLVANEWKWMQIGSFWNNAADCSSAGWTAN